jgi:hypothetical protein
MPCGVPRRRSRPGASFAGRRLRHRSHLCPRFEILDRRAPGMLCFPAKGARADALHPRERPAEGDRIGIADRLSHVRDDRVVVAQALAATVMRQPARYCSRSAESAISAALFPHSIYRIRSRHHPDGSAEGKFSLPGWTRTNFGGLFQRTPYMAASQEDSSLPGAAK